MRLRLIPILFSLILALPILGIFAALLNPGAGSWDTLSHLLSTVLPGYAFTTLLMASGVAVLKARMKLRHFWRDLKEEFGKE